MKWAIHKRISPLAVAIMALLALAVHFLLHVPLWLAFAFPFLGLLITVVVATIDDTRQGGFNEPKDPASEE